MRYDPYMNDVRSLIDDMESDLATIIEMHADPSNCALNSNRRI